METAKAISSTAECEATIIMLNKAYADEWLAFMQYTAAAKLVKGIIRKDVEEQLLEHANEELEHAHKLSRRIIQMGGTILQSPEDFISEANCSFMKVTDSCVMAVVEQTIASERCAIAVYKRLMEQTHGRDQVTYHLVMGILNDELEHEEEFCNFKEDLELFVLKLKNGKCHLIV